MWQVWQATLLAWLLIFASLCGVKPWQDSQVAWLWSSLGRSRPCLSFEVVLRSGCRKAGWALKVWQSEQTMLAPSLAICTSSSRDGFYDEESRSPCSSASPPPPLKWQAPRSAAGLADVLGDLAEVRRLELFLARRAFHWLELTVGIQRVAGIGAEFLVGACSVVAGETIDIVLVGKVVILVLQP